MAQERHRRPRWRDAASRQRVLKLRRFLFIIQSLRSAHEGCDTGRGRTAAKRIGRNNALSRVVWRVGLGVIGGRRTGLCAPDRTLLHHSDRSARTLPECAAFCRSVVEEGRTEGDFIALAAYQLGPEKPIDLPPANMSMPAPVDPKNVYAGAGAGMFSPAVAGHLSRVYSPNLTTGKVDVIDPETFKVIESLDAIPSPRAHRAVVGPADAVGLGRHQLSRRPRRRDADRSRRPASSARRSRCPIPTTCISPPTASRRSWSPRRCGGSSSAIRASMALQGYIATPKCPGHQPRRFFAADGSYAIFTCEYDNALAKIDLVHHRSKGCCRCRAAVCRRTSASRPTVRCSSSPTC